MNFVYEMIDIDFYFFKILTVPLLFLFFLIKYEAMEDRVSGFVF